MLHTFGIVNIKMYCLLLGKTIKETIFNIVSLTLVFNNTLNIKYIVLKHKKCCLKNQRGEKRREGSNKTCFSKFNCNLHLFNLTT